MTSEVQSWLDKAQEDWVSAQWLLHEESPLTPPAAFHLQQCVEKPLKAYLVKHSVEFDCRHDLEYLLQLTGDEKLQSWGDLLDDLTPFEVENSSIWGFCVLDKK